MLDASSPLPLYHQLAEELLAQIRSGSLGAGAKLPGEHQLAERYGVGRPTVRQATDSLIQRGLLVRKRGSGTFVRHVPAQVDLFSLAGTLVSFERGGMAWRSHLLRRPKLQVVEDETNPLHGREVTHIARLSEVDDQPVLLLEGARAETLTLKRGTAVLQVDRTLHFARAERAIFARMFCRTDRLSFSQRLQGNQHG
mgnify:CR=1 FL=1